MRRIRLDSILTGWRRRKIAVLQRTLFLIKILPPFKMLEPDTQLELRPSTRIREVLCKLRRFFFCVVCQSELLFYCRPVTDGVDYCTVERIIFREIFFKLDFVL